jgi:Polyketide cyclase / dehydrase and lipid transport
MYTITAAASITADLDTVWATVIDVEAWPAWDPHEEQARLDGPFAAGTTGWSKPHGAPAATWTITEVVPGRRWGSACGLPGGRITGMNTFEAAGAGQVRCTKSFSVTGPLVPLFRLHFGRRIRRDMVRSFAALELEASRRVAAAGAEPVR